MTNKKVVLKVADLKPGFYLFGNHGAVWSNECHIAHKDHTTLCGVPMLSNNWARIENVQEIGCQECIEKYNAMVKLFNQVVNNEE